MVHDPHLNLGGQGFGFGAFDPVTFRRNNLLRDG
jgi:hypothetical protein